MGVDYRLMNDKCELRIRHDELDDFVKSQSDFIGHEFSETDLVDGSYWLSDQLGIFGGYFDIHINRTRDGILIDDLVVGGEDRMHEKYLDYLKELFMKHNGTLWAWLLNEYSYEYQDFFKIETSKETEYEFDPRPKDWFEPIQENARAHGKTAIDVNELRAKIKDGDFAFYSDKCEGTVSMDDVRRVVQPIIDESEEVIKENVVEDIDDFHDTYFNYRLHELGKLLELPEYSTALQWLGPTNLDINFDFHSTESGGEVLGEVGLATYVENGDSHIETIMRLSESIINLFLNKGETVWGFFESITDGRPDGW
jgi:hypothetical protein